MVHPGQHSQNQIQAVELYIEPVTAWRAWDICRHKQRGLMLRSVTYYIRWPIRKPMRAHCMTTLRGHVSKHSRWSHPTCPNVKHGCGIYAVKTQEQALKWAPLTTAPTYSTNRMRLTGRVKLWGYVVEFSEGYLAEYASPIELVTPKDPETRELVEELAERYGCELIQP